MTQAQAQAQAQAATTNDINIYYTLGKIDAVSEILALARIKGEAAALLEVVESLQLVARGNPHAKIFMEKKETK